MVPVTCTVKFVHNQLPVTDGIVKPCAIPAKVSPFLQVNHCTTEGHPALWMLCLRGKGCNRIRAELLVTKAQSVSLKLWVAYPLLHALPSYDVVSVRPAARLAEDFHRLPDAFFLLFQAKRLCHLQPLLLSLFPFQICP